MTDRRRAVRRAPVADEPLAQARLRGGGQLTIVNLSDRGALVDGGRILPGTHIDVHVTTREGRVLVRSRVVRAFVVSVEAQAIRYRGGIAFEQGVDTSFGGYAIPDVLGGPAGEPGTGYPATAEAGDGTS